MRRRHRFWTTFGICRCIRRSWSKIHLLNQLTLTNKTHHLVPTLAVGARRLHDIGKSGWWLLISLIPVIGWILLLIFFVKDGQPGVNQWGSNPKE
ncbi:MAG: DUF805 domain-containing protein [Bacteroidales bacterium]|nr:DUF805 domain-containing protein [Bacteroidales bacterium]